MFKPQQRRSSSNNNNYSCSSKTLNLQLPTRLLLCVQLTLCCWTLLWQSVDAAELPAELMLEGVSLLKSMEYAQERQQQQQQQHQQQQQNHHHQQKPHLLQSQLKRFNFDPNTAAATAAGADVDIDGMQAPAMSPGDIARIERELFLQSAIDDVPLNDELELPPLEANSMEHADLMERAIDYQQHQASPSSMWLQQPHNNGMGGDSKMASSTFLKMHQPFINHQKQHQKHSKQRLSGDIAASINSDTLVPPPSPIAEPQRHCAIEISSKLTGVCQAMAPIGSACVAGDYMDVYNQDCL